LEVIALNQKSSVDFYILPRLPLGKDQNHWLWWPLKDLLSIALVFQCNLVYVPSLDYILGCLVMKLKFMIRPLE
jgi:hypothetical protein